MFTLISIIGEQPIPNILPILYLKPQKNIILFTDKTLKTANNLSSLVSNTEKIKIDAYDFNSITDKLEQKINVEQKVIFNISGGTKIMSIALFQFALEKESEIVYLQSEGNKTLLYRYSVNKDMNLKTSSQILPELLDVKLYLKSHLPFYNIENNNNYSTGIKFENIICSSLKNNGFEVLQNIRPKGEGNQLEIDAILRLKGTNNVAIAEIKIGDKEERNPKKGIDQLALAGQRDYLGTYTKRFLIISRNVSKHIKDLAKAHNINIIDDIKFNNDNLTLDSKNKLINRIKEKLQ